jgi:four helix bundle suffix protein
MLFTLTKQAMYLIQKLVASLEHKHMTEGGFKENLLRTRLEYRKNLNLPPHHQPCKPR